MAVNYDYRPIAAKVSSANLSGYYSRSERISQLRNLNLIRNRKGPLPHIVAVTAEPLPTRIAALALGTGDLDCVYHFALPELEASIKDIKNEDQLDILKMRSTVAACAISAICLST